MKYLIPAAILSVACFNLYNDVHWPPWVLLSVLASLYIGFITWVLYNPSIGVAIGYTLLTVSIGAFHKPIQEGVMHEVLMMKGLALETGFIMLLLCVAFHYIPRADLKHVKNGLILVFVIQAIWLLFDVLTGWKGLQGLLGNKSIGSSYLAIVGMLNPWLLVLATITVLVTKSSVSGVALAVGFLGTLIIKSKNYLVYGVVLAVLVITAVLLDEQRLPNMPRWNAWAMFINEWIDGGKHFFGEGQGSFMFWGPHAQLTNEFEVKKGLWLWAHNDWLQLLIETGIVGIMVYLNLFRSVLVHYYREQNWSHVGMTLSFGVVMLGNYPLAIAMFGIITAYLIRNTRYV
jgi:hypothetical protein